MYLQVEHGNGTCTAYFGISDLENSKSDKVRIAFHSDVGLDSDRRYRTEEGTVVTGVSEAGYSVRGAYETIADLAIEEETQVVVAVTDHYPWIAEAARKLERQEDFDGDLEVIEQND